jgi:hypothetical protein
MLMQVLNRNDFALKGRFDGRDYTFPPGRALEIPEEAVRHIFGFGQDNRTGAYNRLGILKPGRTLAEAQEVIDRMQFTAGRMVFEQPDPVPQPDKPRPGPDKNEDEEEDESESGKASAQQLAPGGSAGASAGAPPIPDGISEETWARVKARIDKNEQKREQGKS